MTAAVLEMKSVTKTFGSTQAMVDVSLRLMPGTIHAVVGENGAGKSTLIKTMTGIHQPSSGEIWVNGVPVVFGGTKDAQKAGVAAIYQEPMVFGDLSVAENIFISHAARPAFINWAALNDDAAAIITRLGVTLDPRRAASELTLAEQQTVEIARALSLNARVLIMDEPSASLSDHEVQRLFGIARALRDQGVAVLYISHRLDEIFALADTVTVLRDGRHISTRAIGDVTQASLISEMVGRDMQGRFARKASRATGDVLLRVDGLGRAGAFRDVSFTVQQGEIVCFSGLVGARRTDVALALFGVAPADSGTISLGGTTARISSPRQAQRLGIAYVSEDRRKLGLAMEAGIAANISLPMVDSYANGWGIIDRVREYADAVAFRGALNIKAASLHAHVGTLSGGNQQKVMLAKWLNTAPRLLIVDEPTRGIDVGAKAEVHQILRDLAAKGVAVIVVSSDLPEVMSLADRVLVMREGRLVAAFQGDAATETDVMRAAVGAQHG